ncbi:protein ecdysoneless, partial [Tanacetum coccineum]
YGILRSSGYAVLGLQSFVVICEVQASDTPYLLDGYGVLAWVSKGYCSSSHLGSMQLLDVLSYAYTGEIVANEVSNLCPLLVITIIPNGIQPVLYQVVRVKFDESGKVIVAQILKHELCLISLDVEGFYDKDIYSMKYAAKIELFLPNKSDDEIVEGSVIMSRTMYAQLMQQTFQAPKGYLMPPRSGSGYPAAEFGMKIACGFEMIYQTRKYVLLEGKGSKCEVYRESLERSG